MFAGRLLAGHDVCETVSGGVTRASGLVGGLGWPRSTLIHLFTSFISPCPLNTPMLFVLLGHGFILKFKYLRPLRLPLDICLIKEPKLLNSDIYIRHLGLSLLSFNFLRTINPNNKKEKELFRLSHMLWSILSCQFNPLIVCKETRLRLH